MAFSFDSAFGIHQYAIGARNARSEILAANIANADTPGYKARDVDFKEALASAMGQTSDNSVKLMRTDDRHASAKISTIGMSNLMYRVPLQPDTGDGNTVDVQEERTQFLENALRYQASLEFLNQRIAQLNRAIRGEQA